MNDISARSPRQKQHASCIYARFTPKDLCSIGLYFVVHSRFFSVSLLCSSRPINVNIKM